MNIILLGKPGSGKDTLADKFYTQYNYKVLTTGALYRKEFEERTPLGLKAHSYWVNGNLCPDDMTNELMFNTILKLNDVNHIVFNGYPRTIEQSIFLEKISKIGLVLDLVVSDENAAKRLLDRGRSDDTKEIIKQRLEIHKQNSISLTEYYIKRGLYHQIDADKNEQEVFSSALKIILTVY